MNQCQLLGRLVRDPDVKGNAIDVYFESHDEALNFGRQIILIYVKEEMK